MGKVLVTGATGFIGRRLVDALLDDGEEVRAMSRRPAAQTGLPRDLRLELIQGDVQDPASLTRARHGVDALYYLVHSMEGGVGEEEAFIELDRLGARHMARAAADAGVSQIIYLSALEPPEDISAHLRSRLEVEAELRATGVPVTVLRAGFIIGPESAGFRMLRGIAGRLKVIMLHPDMHHRTQPAFIDDVITALVATRQLAPTTLNQTYDLGSREIVEYADMIRDFCRLSGRHVRFEEVPWVPRRMASIYIAAISDLPYGLVLSLSHGLATDLFVEHTALYDLCPKLQRTHPTEAMRRALMGDA